MTALPHTVKDIDLLKWVKAHPNEPFDPPMVVATTGHTSDWEWQAVVAQMEDLARQTYITKLKQDPKMIGALRIKKSDSVLFVHLTIDG